MRIHTFPTFERELQEVRTLTGFRVPPLTRGAVAWFRDLPTWLNQGEDTALDGSALVMPDPSLNLSLPYPRDELLLALFFGVGTRTSPRDLTTFASTFRIDADLLDRPVSVLSGGERMLVSLAKAAAIKPRLERLAICSPFFWLDSANQELVNEHFAGSSAADTHLLVLDGEQPDTGSPPAEQRMSDAVSEASWTLQMTNISQVFASVTTTGLIQQKSLDFRPAKNAFNLLSPTLLTGPNGSGKTTLAKILAGIVDPTSGSTSVSTAGYSGHARILMQDTVVQLFSVSAREHLEQVFKYDKDRRRLALETFNRLETSCVARLSRDFPSSSFAESDGEGTMLQCKLSLVAERLAHRPPLLVLDEPGWCLSRPVASAFVKSVAEVAHSGDRKTAILVISHQSGWWNDLVRSRLELAASQGTVDIVETPA